LRGASMLTVYNCIANAHDLRLVGLAVVICALASFTAINLLHHVRRSDGRMRRFWLCVAAVVTGFGIWATHFIAMLAFSPGMPSGYNIALTLLSLLAAILLTGAGLVTAVSAMRDAGAWLGGAIVGGGIAAMHYTGMAAFEIQGHIIWNPVLVALSIALGGLLAAAALPVGLRSAALKWKFLGALILHCRRRHRPGSDHRDFKRGTAGRTAVRRRCFRKLRHHRARVRRCDHSNARPPTFGT
jgi:NO-binding membrane sensor protein with MHYT domain